MANWKLHLPREDNLFDQYKCGLTAGDRVRLKKDLVVTDSNGLPTGQVHPAGEEWVVLSGVKSDPVLWLRRPDGERCTCNDDAKSVDEWFERP
jgi:hypothetical protein